MPNLIGFEKAPGLGNLLAQFGVFHDYRAELPNHLLDVLRKQHSAISIESIELLNDPKCNLGGMRDTSKETVVNVQNLELPMDLRLMLVTDSGRFMLELRLVLKREWLGSQRTTTSDMFVRSQSEAV